MTGLQPLAKMIMAWGLVLLVIGGLLFLMGKWLGGGRVLPGDIYIQRPHFVFYFPLVTCILLSILVTLVLWLIGFWRR